MLMNSLDVFMQKNYFYTRYRKRWIVRAVSRYFSMFLHELKNTRILEIGCGGGHGAHIIKKFSGADEVTATDLDPQLISKARSGAADPSISFEVADASALSYPDEYYDAIFDFGVIHHIPEWRQCLGELHRVVKVGGRVFLVDSPIESFGSLLGRLARVYTSHPYAEMFSEEQFMNRIHELGFKVLLRDVFRPNLYYFVLVLEK
jgi:ubiquinone/menaquinone biosynthesis C-methylase UbiE